MALSMLFSFLSYFTNITKIIRSMKCKVINILMTIKNKEFKFSHSGKTDDNVNNIKTTAKNFKFRSI